MTTMSKSVCMSTSDPACLTLHPCVSICVVGVVTDLMCLFGGVLTCLCFLNAWQRMWLNLAVSHITLIFMFVALKGRFPET